MVEKTTYTHIFQPFTKDEQQLVLTVSQTSLSLDANTKAA